MNQTRILKLCALLLLGAASLQAAISVGPTGTGVQTFNALPAVTDWSTLGFGTAAGTLTTAAALDDAVQLRSAADVNVVLASSATVPPSANAVARLNTAGGYLQTRPTGTDFTLLMATLKNDTGASASFVDITYTLGLVLAAGSTPGEDIPGHRVYYSTTGAAGSWKLIPGLSGGTPGTLTARLDVGAWAPGSLLYILWADDNGPSSTTAPSEEGAYTIDNFEAKALSEKEPALTSFTPNALGFSATIENGGGSRTVNQGSIAATVNGTAATPVVTKNGDIFTVSVAGAALTPSATNTIVLNFTDNATPAKSYSITRIFATPAYTLIPGSFAVTGVDTTKRGFKANVNQISVARTPGDQNSTENAERQIAGQILDPNTGQPYPNDVDTTTAVNGIFIVPTVINWNQDAPAATGDFSDLSTPPITDDPIPGIPGLNLSNDNIAAEVLTFLDLKAGAYTMGVNSDDGFKVTVGPNPRDALSLVLGNFNTGRGVADTLFNFVVEKDGIYPFRLLWWEGGGGAALEWFSVSPTGEKILINDPNNSNAIKAYQNGPTGPVFIRTISPLPGLTNVAGNSVINIVLADSSTRLQTNSVQLFVNDQKVSPSISRPPGSTTDTQISYDAPGDFSPEAVVRVKLIYTDNTSVTRTNEYSFKVKPQILVAINSDTVMWRYENTGKDLGTAWKEKTYDDSTWPEGAPLLALETGATAEPIRTQLVRVSPDGVQIVTDYFRTHFRFDGNPAAVQLILNHVVDDGAVFYLNGVEVHRFGIAVGATFNSTTLFTDHENAYAGPFLLSSGSLVQGDNVLAAETHQSSTGSSDIVFGAELSAMVLTNVPPTSIESISPTPGSNTAQPDANIAITLLNGTRQVATNTIRLEVNGQPVTPVITRASGSISTVVAYDPPVDFVRDTTVNVKLTFSDDANPANVTTREFSFNVEPLFTPIIKVDDANQLWKYENTGQTNLGSAWTAKSYNDTAWPAGPAVLALETGAIGAPIATPLSRTSPDGVQIVADYFRTHFNWDGDPASTRLRIRHLIDDGAVFYINGVEVLRFGLATNATFDASTLFADHENAWVGPVDISNGGLVKGDNVLAVEVHQSSTGSSDVVMGVELEGAISSKPATPAKFTAASVTAGNLKLEWTGTGVLQSADTVTGPWTDIAGAASPYTASATGKAKFYRFR